MTRIEDKELNITGYADLVVTIPKKKIVYEINSKNSKAFWYMEKKKEGANHQHQLQIWTYLWKLNIAEGRLIYLSKDDLSILEYPVYLNDQFLMMEVMNELTVLNKAWEAKLPPPPIINKEDWRYKYCRWHKMCLSREKYLQM